MLSLRGAATNRDSAAEHLMSLVLVPDLGTAPVVRYRKMLRRLATFRERGMLTESSAEVGLEIVVATPNADRTEARSSAWQDQLDVIIRRHGPDALQMRVVTWDRVADTLKRIWRPKFVADDGPHTRATACGTPCAARWPAPTRNYEQLLHLIGRHPCLTINQLAVLLGTGVDRIRRLERELIEQTLLRRIGFEELPPGATPFSCEEFTALGLVEITSKGRRQVAGWLGLAPALASRLHGLNSNARHDARRRWGLMRALRHTLGANEVFVAFAVAAEAARRARGDDQLAEWRSAAACERRHCKPDGYGQYVRNGTAHGFFLEFDRGTEPARKYAAKFRAFYQYRDTGQFQRDYNGFPALLFVTTDPAAEQRIAGSAYRAWFTRGTQPLTVLITTTDRIGTDREGVLGRIWRRVPAVASLDGDLERWPPHDGAMPLLGRVSDGINAGSRASGPD